MKYDNFDSRMTDIAERELMAGERLLWVGMPDPLGRAMSNFITPLFGIVWLVIVSFIGGTAGGMMSGGFGGMSGGVNSIFSLIIPIFYVVGIGMLLSPVYYYVKALRTVYAVTDRRLLIIVNLLPSSVRSYDASELDNIERRGGRGERGDIIFAHEQRTRRVSMGGGDFNSSYRRQTYMAPVGFFGIEHVREVEALLLETFFSGDEAPGGKRKRDS